MRFLVALASIVFGLAVAAGFIYRDNPNILIASDIPQTPLQTSTITPQVQEPVVPKIVAPQIVGEIADAQPTVLNADRSRFESVATVPAPKPISQAEEDRAKRVLVMALQGELRRVRCYDGAVNGSWNTPSKAAMFWFLKRVNAKMPVNVPDHAQLNLLKSAANDFCAEKEAPTHFVTKVVPEDHVAEGIPNPTSTIQDTSFSEARRRAGLPRNGRVAADGSTVVASDDTLPAPMAVGVVEPKKKRKYRASSRRVENLFKHPLGSF